MKTMLGRGQANAPTSPKSAFDMQVRVKIKVGQADIPAGLSRLFNLMEQGVSSTRLGRRTVTTIPIARHQSNRHLTARAAESDPLPIQAFSKCAA
jgi:hypothetical protein